MWVYDFTTSESSNRERVATSSLVRSMTLCLRDRDAALAAPTRQFTLLADGWVKFYIYDNPTTTTGTVFRWQSRRPLCRNPVRSRFLARTCRVRLIGDVKRTELLSAPRADQHRKHLSAGVMLFTA